MLNISHPYTDNPKPHATYTIPRAYITFTLKLHTMKHMPETPHLCMICVLWQPQ